MSLERKVHCIKFNAELPGLAKPPFAGQIGQDIFEKVSEKAWKMWKDDLQIKVINEYRLNLGDSKDYNVLIDQMLTFLNLKQGNVAEVENKERGNK